MIQLKEEELSTLCQHIVELLPKGGVVILRGDLASGKTTFTRAFAQYLGLNEPITSPTFSLQHCYGERLYHYDLYNYGFDKFLSLGMMEEIDKEGYHLIEWGDEKLAEWLRKAYIDFITVTISKCDETSRCYEVDNA